MIKQIKWLFLLTSFLFAAPIQDHKIDLGAVSELSFALNTPLEQWLRKPDQERWEMAELPPDQRGLVFDWAKEQGLFDPWKPLCKEYDKVLLFGATTPRMEMRLNFLKQLWNEGVRFKEIVWLTGERPLDPRVDRLLDRCKNEAEAAQAIWEGADLPEELGQLPILFVTVPMQGSKRPTIEDTVSAWLKMEPEPCKALFLSDQPFCGYQFAFVKAILPDDFPFDFAAQSLDLTKHPAGAAVILDSIARWVCLQK